MKRKLYIVIAFIIASAVGFAQHKPLLLQNNLPYVTSPLNVNDKSKKADIKTPEHGAYNWTNSTLALENQNLTSQKLNGGGAVVMAAPANDNCANAIAITMNATGTIGSYTGTASGTNSGASGDIYNSLCFSVFSNVWYTFTAPVAGSYFIDVIPGTMRYPELSLETGGCGGGITEWNCAGASNSGTILDVYSGNLTPYQPFSYFGGNHNSTTYSYASICDLAANQKVYIMIDSWSTTGTYTVNVTTLKNDNIAQPLIIDACGTTFNSTTIGATNCDNGVGSGYADNLDNNSGTFCTGSGAASCGNGSGAAGTSCNSGSNPGYDVGYTVENDSWYEFCVTQASTVTLTFSPNTASCLSTGTSALQISVFKGSVNNLTKVAGGYCGMVITSSTTYTFALVTNDCVFVEVDGYAGTNCDYSLQASIIPTCVLPVKMVYFKGDLNDKLAAKLEWATQTEDNADYFLIEKSTDGQNFTKLTSVKAKGNSSTLLNYEAYDNNPNKGINYYRLSSFDKNGQRSFFGYATVTNNGSLSFFNLFPNPAQNIITMKLQNFSTPTVSYELYDGQGRLIKKENVALVDGSIEHSINLSELEKGMFFIKLSDGETIYRKTFIKSE